MAKQRFVVRIILIVCMISKRVRNFSFSLFLLRTVKKAVAFRTKRVFFYKITKEVIYCVGIHEMLVVVYCAGV